MFSIFPKNDDDQTLRIKRFLLAFGAYLIWNTLVVFIYLIGLSRVPLIILASCVSGNIIANILIYAIIRTGLNKRFKDPSLTLIQMVIATFWIMVIVFYADSSRSAVLLVYLVVLVFGFFRLNVRQFLILSAYAWVNYSAVVFLVYKLHPESFNKRVDILNIIILACILPWFAMIGGYLTKLRSRISKALSTIKQLTDNIHDVIFVTDMNLNYTYISPSVKNMRGYEPEEVLQQTLSDAFASSSVDAAMKAISGIMELEKSGSPDSLSPTLQLEIKRKDGTAVWTETKFSLVRDKHQRTVGLLGVSRDTTGRKQAESQKEAALESLRQSEEKYRTILENIEDGYYEVDLFGNLTFFNDSLCRLYGYSKEELMGMNNRQYADQETSKEVFQAYNKVYSTGEPSKEVHWQAIRKDGTKRYVETTASLQKNSSGKPIGFRGIVRDITGRRQAEFQREAALEELRESEIRYRTLFEKSRDAIMILEPPSWKFTAGNPAAIEIFKAKNEEEFLSSEPWVFSPGRQPDGRASDEKAKEMIEKAIRDGFNFFEWTHKRIRGDEFPATVLLSKVEKNGHAFLQATVRDITERRQVEDAMKDTNERFRSIVSWSEDAIIVTDAKGKIEFMNPAAGRVFNREVEGFLGTEFGLPLVNGESTEMDIFRPGKDPGVGDMYVVETEWLGEKAHLITIRDITERKQTEAKIKQTQEELFIINNKLEERNNQNNLLSGMRELLQSCSNVQEVPAIVISYAAKLFSGTNGALFMLSDSRTDLQSVASWGNFPEDVDNNIFAPDACWGLRQGRVYAVEDMKTGPICRHLKKTSSTAYICLPLIGKGEILGLLHLGTKRSVQEDDRQANIFELKEIAILFAEYLSLSIANIKLSEKLISQSIRDPLTRLYNRRYMDEIIQHEILRAARQTIKIGVVMIDIDHFKQINDTYGHDAGDEFLIKLAGFFKLKLRGSDFIFRYGGEEFLLILPESSVEDTYKYAESLREEIKNMKVHFRGQQLPAITLSFGIAEYPDHGLDTIELIRIADKALYKAKEEGRDRVVIG